MTLAEDFACLAQRFSRIADSENSIRAEYQDACSTGFRLLRTLNDQKDIRVEAFGGEYVWELRDRILDYPSYRAGNLKLPYRSPKFDWEEHSFPMPEVYEYEYEDQCKRYISHMKNLWPKSDDRLRRIGIKALNFELAMIELRHAIPDARSLASNPLIFDEPDTFCPAKFEANFRSRAYNLSKLCDWIAKTVDQLPDNPEKEKTSEGDQSTDGNQTIVTGDESQKRISQVEAIPECKRAVLKALKDSYPASPSEYEIGRLIQRQIREITGVSSCDRTIERVFEIMRSDEELIEVIDHKSYQDDYAPKSCVVWNPPATGVVWDSFKYRRQYFVVLTNKGLDAAANLDNIDQQRTRLIDSPIEQSITKSDPYPEHLRADIHALTEWRDWLLNRRVLFENTEVSLTTAEVLDFVKNHLWPRERAMSALSESETFPNEEIYQLIIKCEENARKFPDRLLVGRYLKRIAYKLTPYLAAAEKSLRSLESEKVANNNDENLEEPAIIYVTLDQAAALVNRSKHTLRNYKDLPPPDIEGGGKGKRHEWLWSKLRPWLESKFDRRLSERPPGCRVFNH